MIHPKPWQVVYRPLFPNWHKHSCPVIADSNGEFVIRPDQSLDVNHPGAYDEKADLICLQIVDAVNLKAE